MEERNNPAKCPVCGKMGRKIMTKVHFNEVFIGSYKHAANVDAAVQMSVEAQKEGFVSRMEMETAVGQAHDRAKELGIPVERILGGHKSPFKGETFRPAETDVEQTVKLNKQLAEATLQGKSGKVQKLRRELSAQQ